MFGGLGEEFGVIDGAFEAGAELCEPAIEEVVGEEAEDGDGETAGGGDEGLSDAARDFRGGELLVADEAEGSHDASDGAEESEERGEGNEGSKDPLESFGVAEFVGGAELHGAQEGGLRVTETVMEGMEKGITGVIGEAERVGESALGEGVESFVEVGGAGAAAEVHPPEGALEDDGEGGDEGGQNGPHDGTAFDKIIDEYVGE